MKRSPHPLLGIGLPLLTIVVFFVLLTFSLVRLSAIERSTMQLKTPQNMLWVITQAQEAGLRLSNTVARWSMGSADPVMLQQRCNVFLSRLKLMRQGLQRRQIEIFGAANALDALQHQLPLLKTNIAGLQPHDRRDALAIMDFLDQYNQLLGRAANKAMVAEWDELVGKLEESHEHIWQIIVSLIGITIAGIALTFYFLAAKREIAMHRDHLEELVEARTRQLDAALERERETAELYRNFGTMISHQFRTPLAIVDSALQRLIRRSDKLTAPEIRQRSDRARDAIARLSRLVESTLDAARLDAGQIDTRSEPCDLGQLAADVCNQQRNAAGDRVITLELVEPGPVFACCDPAHAEHIVTNLLSNAIKYAKAGTVISVRVCCNGDQVECAVTNQGTLAPMSNPDTLFQRYYRGSNAKGLPGIGIGLYMAQALARLQGGEVRLVHGAAGHVTFILRLPRATAQHRAYAAAREPE